MIYEESIYECGIAPKNALWTEVVEWTAKDRQTFVLCMHHTKDNEIVYTDLVFYDRSYAIREAIRLFDEALASNEVLKKIREESDVE